MGKGSSKQRKRKPANAVVDRFCRPTPEREAANDFRSAGIAVRVIPVIETMVNAGKLTRAQFEALDYYRDQAQRAEDDCAQCGTLAPERMMGGASGGGGGGRIPVSVLMATPAILETARIERDLGQLRDIARAVAVDDITLTQWCIAKHGGRERYGPGGKFVAVVPLSEKSVMGIALMELRYAAGMIAR